MATCVDGRPGDGGGGRAGGRTPDVDRGRRVCVARRGAEWVRAFAAAEAKFTHELADSLPAAVRTTVEHASGLADTAAQQARRVPGVEPVEGEARGAVAREEDLPIRNYDQLTASEIIQRLDRLSGQDLHKVDAYERKHANRKTVHEKVEALTR